MMLRTMKTTRAALIFLAMLVVACSEEKAEAPSKPASTSRVDLVMLPEHTRDTLQLREATLSPNSCAVVEGCVGAPGDRRLLVFTAAIANLGEEDLRMGDPAGNALYSYSPCHGHFHLDGLAAYELLSQGGTVAAGTLATRKQGFCLEDSERVAGSRPAAFDCQNQGITAGWADVYESELDCQWIDVTGVAAGTYVLRLTANPNGALEEARLDNNAVELPVVIGP
jgi:hypothetical protein